MARETAHAFGTPVLKMSDVAGVKDAGDKLFDHYAILIIAAVLVAAGKTMVKSPAVEVLSEPKSRTATAALVSVVLAFELAEGVLL
jgi:hypothetical protein